MADVFNINIETRDSLSINIDTPDGQNVVIDAAVFPEIIIKSGLQGLPGQKGDKGDMLTYASLTADEKNEVVGQVMEVTGSINYTNIFLNAYLQ